MPSIAYVGDSRLHRLVTVHLTQVIKLFGGRRDTDVACVLSNLPITPVIKMIKKINV